VVALPVSWHECHTTDEVQEQDKGKKTLVLDLDETLVHSSFKPIPNPDYIIPVEIEGKIVDVYVLKRPWLDHFMAAIAGRFEVVVFTASLSKYAGEVLFSQP
jgi:RNA polymerase II subunit A small phosphatase-like protein